MITRRSLMLAVAPLIAGAAPRQRPPQTVPVHGYTVVRTLPHDRTAFTQGLTWFGGALYESTGQYGQSSIRKVRLETGAVERRAALPAQVFGEGSVVWRDRLIAITWTSGVGFVFGRDDFRLRRRFTYAGEGWGLTQDGRRLILSDGTPTLRFLDPETLAETGRVTVTAGGRPVARLNELEWVKGEVWANVWMTNLIARIDPATGVVKGWIDLTGLLPLADQAGAGEDGVLNGIAYDAAGDRVFVTGKYWPKLFQIRVTPGAAR